MQLLIASNNLGKIAELKKYFKYMGQENIEILTPADFRLSSPEETETTFAGNAELKARFYGEKVDMLALADDTGVCINGLNGQPGVYTANWIEEHGGAKNLVEKLSKDLKEDFDRIAVAVCALSLYDPKTKQVKTVVAKTEGKLDFSYKDNEAIMGFSYIFIPDGYDLPYEQLSFEERFEVSHRAKALKSILHQIISN